ncbi:DUF3649 domain-containing protein [Vreelandella alkaliphila]|uniref:DUF3649 domain-containing protein n=1 Tax=Vreelandella alkaliphila TaxID=272774 RepID=UPI003F94EEC9
MNHLLYGSRVVSRIVAAILGGYAMAHAVPIMLLALWPIPRSEAVMWAAQLSFVVYLCAIIWVFAMRSATRAWLGLAVSSAICGLLAWWWL